MFDITGAADIYTSSKRICCGKQGYLGTWERSDTENGCIEFYATHVAHTVVCLLFVAFVAYIVCSFVRCSDTLVHGNP